MQRLILTALVITCAGLRAGAQQEVLWAAPGGGDYHVGSNWVGGVPPTSNQGAVFQVAGAYAITASAPVHVGQLKFLGGEPTVAMGGNVRVFAIVADGGQGAPMTIDLASGFLPYDSMSGGYSIQLRNARLRWPWSCDACAVGLSAGSEMTVQHVFGYRGSSVDATSTLRINSYFYGTNFTSTGRIILSNAFFTLDSLSQTGGEIIANGSEIHGDGIGISGGTHVFTDSVITARPAFLSTDLTFNGPASAQASVLPPSTQVFSGHVRLRGGARLLNPITVSGGTLDLGAGSSALLINLGDAGTLRVGAGATANGAQFGTVSNAGTIALELDALSRPAEPPVSLAVSSGTGGPLVLEVLNPNALRVGDTVGLVREASGTPGDFSGVQLPALPGGRQLELSMIGDTYTLRVVAGGGEPCWTGDFNGDGDFGTDQDIEAFFACLGGSCCATCGSADFNSDGDTGTDQDIEAFFRILTGGAC